MGLKKIIFEEQNFDDLSFKLWKVDIPLCRQGEKLIRLITNPFNIRKDLGGLEMKDTDDIDIFKLFLNNDEKNIHILVEPHINFKICTEKMELVQNDIIINSDSLAEAEGLITFTSKGFKIVVNELRFSSFKEFIQQTTSDQHKKSKENLMIYIHELKITLDWPSFRLRVLYERKTNRGLRKLCKDLGGLEVLEAKAVPEVGNREIRHVFNNSGIAIASVLFAEEYAKVIPIVFAYPGEVDGKTYIIAVLNPEKKSNVHVRRVPDKFKGFPVMIGYGTFEQVYRGQYDNLSPGISIGDLTISSTGTLGAFFKTEAEPEKVYLLTVEHVVGEVGGSITQPGILDNGHLTCATITQYKSLRRNEDGCLLDYSFCRINNNFSISKLTNHPYRSHIGISGIKGFVGTGIDAFEEPLVPIQKVGRTTGHTEGLARDYLYTFTDLLEFDFVKGILVLDAYGDSFCAKGDSGSPVFDENGILWGIVYGYSESHGATLVVPIIKILDDARQNGMDFRLM